MRRLWLSIVVAAALAIVAMTPAFAQEQEEGLTLTGTITNWRGGEAEVRALQYNPMSPNPIATSTIADDGSFEITLPPTPIGPTQSQVERILGGCEDVAVTPEGTRFGLGRLTVYRNGEAIADVSSEQVEELVWSPPVGSQVITLAYFNNDATIQARCEDVNNPFFWSETTHLDIEVAQGWNALVWTVTETRWPEEHHRTAEASVGGGEDFPWVAWFNGRIGVRIEPNEEHSAVVAAVEPDSPAEQAGLLVGDVISEVDGQDVRGKSPILLLRGEPGTTIAVSVMREGELVEFEATRERR